MQRVPERHSMSMVPIPCIYPSPRSTVANNCHGKILISAVFQLPLDRIGRSVYMEPFGTDPDRFQTVPCKHLVLHWMCLEPPWYGSPKLVLQNNMSTFGSIRDRF